MTVLATIAKIVLALAGGLVVVVVGLALVPIRFAITGVFTDARVDAELAARWGLLAAEGSSAGVVVRLLGWAIYRGPGRDAGPDATPTEPAPEPAAKPAAKRSGWRPPLRMIARMLRRAAPSLRLRARVYGRLGTGDPADTAALHGALIALQRAAPGVDTRGIRIDWLEPALDLEGRVEGRIWLAALVWVFASEYTRARLARPIHRRGVFQ